MGHLEPVSGEDSLSRRKFIVTGISAAGGLALGFAFPGLAFARPLSSAPWSNDAVATNEINAWILIDPDETITIRIPHAEMGQGAGTANPMIVAEELECDWAKIKGEFASPNRNVRENNVYKDQNTVGSRGVATSWQYLQQAGASARGRLIQAAANRWNVAATECVAENGAVLHKASNRRLTYGQVAADASKIKLDKEPAIKSPDQFKLIGKPMPRLDTPVKVNGEAKFGIDSKVPGMVYAAIESCPVVGGTLASVDESGVAGKRGIVKVVKLKDAVAVVADNTWRAMEGLNALKITWNYGPGANSDSAQMKQLYRDTLNEPMVQARKDGDAAGVLAQASRVVEAVYEVPHLAHAPMEPLNATVHLQADRLDVWMGTQSALSTLQQGAEASGLKPEQVYIHNAYLGGGFGRRSKNDEMVQAIAIAKDIGKPVKLTWSREQDMRGDRYRPQAAAKFRAALGPDGMPLAVETKLAVGSINRSLGRPVDNGLEGQAVDGIANSPYKIPNFYVGGAMKNTHLLVNFWRSVGGSQNCFFYESFIDELAHAAGKDPLEFRRAMVDRVDFVGVIEKLNEKSNWKTKLPKGQGRGIAVAENHGSVVGTVAEVTVNDRDQIRVDRLVVAVDCYHVVNPKIIEAQMESGAIYGLSAVLYGEMSVKAGQVQELNFDTYRVVRQAEAPKIEVYLVPSGGAKWGGIGECGTATIAPAIANAIFAASGKRVRELPLKNVKLSQLASI
ncbi:MAG TPA: xanthine dehydrogenase family protein molybdopterin-binding subunit [Micropepsaceae bacterium]|nr:xanthine dehydrogenase family protein molybdopterin-binding subunit [Micropepsaceae bacterium]